MILLHRLLVALLAFSNVATLVSFKIQSLSSRTKSKTTLFEYDPWSPIKKMFDKKPSPSSSNVSPSTVSKGKSRPIEIESVVVGAGISGCTTAYYLQKNGVDVVLAEAKDEVGGALVSKTKDGFLWEEGPLSFQPNPTVLRFAKDLGLIDNLVFADPTLPRYIYWEDGLFALPGGLSDLPAFNLLSWPGKIRAGLGALGFIAPPPEQEESVREFVTRHVGTEVFERIVDPFVSGVYVGDPDKLSMRAALRKVKNLEDLGVSSGLLDGAIVRIKQIKAEKEANIERDADLPEIPGGSIGSFKGGLQSIPLAVKDYLNKERRVKLGHKLVNVERDGSQWLSTFDVGEKQVRYRSKSLIITCPAYVTASIIGNRESGVMPKAMDLNRIDYPPVASVTLAYPNSDLLEPDRQGICSLIPRSQKIRTLGTLWTSSLFPSRAPEEYTMYLSYIGGTLDPEVVNLSTDELVAEVHRDMQKVGLLRPTASRPKVLGVKVWSRAVPQFNKGHLELISGIEMELQKYPGLYLGGNYKTGVAFSDCVQYGVDVAEEASTFLSVADVAENVEKGVGADAEGPALPLRIVEKTIKI